MMTKAMVATLVLIFFVGCESIPKNSAYDESSRYPGYPSYDEVVRFHGHSCPGSMFGYRMAIAGMNKVKAAGIDPKEIHAIVENNNCGVDALQVVASCTFGKKRLIFRDHGKNVYTLFSPNTKRGFKITLNPDNIPEQVQEDRDEFTRYLYEAPEDEFLLVTEVTVAPEIPRATRESIACPACGEQVSKNRTVDAEGKKVCIPCSE